MHYQTVDWVLFCQWRPQSSSFDPIQPEVPFHCFLLSSRTTEGDSGNEAVVIAGYL